MGRAAAWRSPMPPGYVALAELLQDTANAFPRAFHARHEGRVCLASLKAAIATERACWILGGLLDERQLECLQQEAEQALMAILFPGSRP